MDASCEVDAKDKTPGAGAGDVDDDMEETPEPQEERRLLLPPSMRPPWPAQEEEEEAHEVQEETHEALKVSSLFKVSKSLDDLSSIAIVICMESSSREFRGSLE